MNQNEFIVEILAGLEKKRSEKQINSDIKQLEKVIRRISLIGTFSKGNTKKELNAYISQLTSQLNHIKLQAKIDNKQLQRKINESLKNISYSDIDIHVNEDKMKMKVRKAVADARAVVDRNPLSFNVEIKKEKLNNQLTSYLDKNSKIKESSILVGEADKLNKMISNISDKNSLRNATEQFQLFKSEVTATGFAGRSTTDKIKNMVGNITKIGSAFGVASTAVNQFFQSQRNLKEIDTILTEISKTSEMTKNQLIELGDASFDTANKYGQLAKNYLLGVQEMARSGYEEKATELGELSLLAQSAGDMTAEMANNYILATDAAYKYSGSIEKLTSALDGANYVSNKNSASLTDIADGVRVSASYAANAGVEIDQLTAAEATMIATTKRSGSEMGRAFRSILLNLQQVSGEFDGEIIDEESLKKVENRCHSLGVELETLKDGVATLRNPMEVLKELSQVYNSLPDSSADKQGLISDIGGKYHANGLSALLSRWDLYEKMLKEFSQGTGSALLEANKTADSWEGRLSQLQNTWDSFVSSITSKDTVKGGISFLDGTIQSFEKLTDTIGTIPAILTAVNASASALNKDYGITELFNKDTHKMDIQGNFMGINLTEIKSQTQHFKEAAVAIDKWNSYLGAGKNNIDDFGEAITKNSVQFKSYLETCSKEAPASLAGYKKYLNEAGISTETFRLKTVLLTSAMSLGIGLAVQTAVSSITKMLHAQEEMRQKAQELTSEFKNTESSIDDYKTKISELHAVMNDSSSSIADTTKARQDLMAIQDELIDKFGREKETIDIITKAIQDQSGALDELSYRQYLQWKNDFNDKSFGKSALDFLSSGNIGDALYKLTELDFSGAWDMLTHPTETNMDSMIDSMEHAYYELEKTGNETLDGLIKKSYGLKDRFDGSKFIISGNLGEIQEDLINVQKLSGDFDVSDRFEADLTRVSNSIDKTLTAYEDAYDTYLLYEKILDKAKDNPYDEQFDSVNKAKEAYDTAFASGNENRIQEEANRFASVLSGAVNVALENNDTDVAGYFRNMYPELQAIVAGWEFSADFKLNTDDIKGKVSGAADQFTSSEDIMSFNPSIASQAQIDAYAALNAAAEQYGMTLEQMIVLLEKENVLQSENRKQLEEKFGKDNVSSLSNEDLEIAYQVSNDAVQAWDRLISKIEEYKASLNSAKNTSAGFAPTEGQSKSIDDFQSNISALQSALEKLNSGKLSDSDFVDLIQQFPELANNSGNLGTAIQTLGQKLKDDLLASLGESPTALTDSIESMADKLYGTTDGVETLSEAISNLQESQNMMDSLNNNIAENGTITTDMINTILAKYPQMNDVLSDYLNNLATQDDVIAALKDVYETDLKNYQKLCLGKKAYDTEFYNSILSKLPKWVSELADSYGIDLKNFKNLAVAKAKVEEALIKASSDLWTRYHAASQRTTSTTAEYEMMQTEKFARNNLNKQKDGEKILAALDDISIDMSGIQAPQFSASGSGGSKSGSKSSKSSSSKKEINWADRKLEVLGKRLDIIKKKASEIASVFKNQNKLLNDAVQNLKRQIEVQKKVKKTYLEQAGKVKLSSSLKKKVRDGSISVGSYDSKTAEKIEEYQKWYDAAKDVDTVITQITLDIKELKKQKIDNIIDDFDRKNSYQQSLIDYREAKMGDTGKTSDYSYLIKKTNSVKANLQKEYNEIKKRFDAMVKDGLIDKYKDDWLEYKELLTSLKVEMEECTESVLEYKKAIMQIRFDKFDKAVETLNSLSSELSNLQSLLSDNFFDGTSLTKDGLANLTLNFQGIANAKKSLETYAKGIAGLEKNLKNGNITQEEYNEKLNEYKAAQKEASLSIKNYRDAIINMAVSSINAETEAMRKLISEKKEALQAEKDLHDYRNSIAEKEQDIAVLQAKIAELSKSSDRKDIALRLELEADLAEAQKDLSETQYDHDMQLKQDALDEELENYEKAQDEKIKELETSLESQEKVLNSYLKQVQNNYSSTMAYISRNAAAFSYSLTDYLSNPWDTGMEKAKSYKDFFDSVMAETGISSGKINTDKSGSGSSSSSGSSSGSSSSSSSSSSNASGSGSFGNTMTNIGIEAPTPDNEKVSKLSGDIKYGSSGSKVTVLQKALKTLGFNPGTVNGKYNADTLSAAKAFQKNTTKVAGDKLSADGVIESKTKKKFKLNGFKKGVRDLGKDQLAEVNEEGQETVIKPKDGVVFPLEKHDTVLSAKQTDNLIKNSKIDMQSALQNAPKNDDMVVFKLDRKVQTLQRNHERLLNPLNPGELVKQGQGADMHFQKLLVPNMPKMESKASVSAVTQHIDASIHVTGITRDEMDKTIEKAKKDVVHTVAKALTPRGLMSIGR